MITTKNYFEKVKTIPVSKLPEKLHKAFLFVQQATEDHANWNFYHKNTAIKLKVDKYLELLNEHMSEEPKNAMTEVKARQYASDFIRSYVHRGDSYESLAKSMMGSSNGLYRAEIRLHKIKVQDPENGNVHFSFPLKRVFDELTNELIDNDKKKKNSSKPAKPAQISPAKPNPQTTVRISYDHSKPVERIEEDIKFIKRCLSLHGKSKTKAQILSFFNAVQRAIVEKRVRKQSKYGDEVMQIQKQLRAAYKIMGAEHTFQLGAGTIKKFSEIVGSARIRLSTQYLKRFIGIQGKNITKEKAKRLLDVIKNALESDTIAKSDPYYANVVTTSTSLKQFIQMANEGDTLEIHQQTLNGLNGVLGCNCDCNNPRSKKNRNLNGLDGVDDTPQVMSVEDVKQKQYDSVPLGAKWKELLGEICLPTHLFVYGSGGSGKTSFALLFTQHLATLGYKILYVAGEQFDTPPFTKLLNQLNIVAGNNYSIVAKLGTLNPADFDFVVLDTKDSLDIDTTDFLKLKEDFNKQSFIIVSHGIKGEGFKGKEQWRNIVDVMVFGDHGTIRTGQDKNRWGGAGEMLIYDHASQYLIKN